MRGPLMNKQAYKGASAIVFMAVLMFVSYNCLAQNVPPPSEKNLNHPATPPLPAIDACQKKCLQTPCEVMTPAGKLRGKCMKIILT